jgi:hypothetical protein
MKTGGCVVLAVETTQAAKQSQSFSILLDLRTRIFRWGATTNSNQDPGIDP